MCAAVMPCVWLLMPSACAPGGQQAERAGQHTGGRDAGNRLGP
jgi:hypothetical protein